MPEIGSALSVVIVTRSSFEPIRRSVRGLAAQTAAEHIELIIVAPSRGALALDAESLKAFGRYRIAEAGEEASIGRANAAGVRASTAPLVAMIEDHVLLDRNWAEALIKAHQGRWAAVGGVMLHANPATATSWADMFISYGPWLEPAAEGRAEFLPGHNTSYKRSALLAYGTRLESLLEAETVLHWILRVDGHELYLDPAVRFAHITSRVLRSGRLCNSMPGRRFAASRASEWSRGKRLAWALAAPAIPAVRLGRLVKSVASRPVLVGQFLRAIPVICAGLTSDGFGQMLGYALGAGQSERQMSQYEYRRDRYLSRRDRATLETSAEV